MNTLSNFFKTFWTDEEGLQTLEILLIVAVVVVIALTFRDKITEWVTTLVNFGDDKVGDITGD
ncbi:Flp1 family type IVb pilin [Alkalicoccobacillus gibsonii]|uniref:Flp1 family type IVb pilin n=1 Tax=Alkalicoccobacillus gibsonii TaxID=79881 RepID=A0ABU9VE15_9BACI|nr:Flp1 family type IVb pilin [Alkalicoccobacillus gibsonii]MBM0066637.1 hypothetical protein [Alkalicoccobacillus gibsonii]